MNLWGMPGVWSGSSTSWTLLHGLPPTMVLRHSLRARTSSSSMEVANLLQHQTEVFGTYPQFLSDCDKGLLPDYSFVEPNFSDHDSDDGEEVVAGRETAELYLDGGGAALHRRPNTIPTKRIT